ncbi:hypothetical protein V6N12_007136 [Hibiscus sabdariffa]|uniref:Uncharacterized protein n=1 Tax=Hibiscus sabdariffa TaxID=183260 RepID=A0ABR2F0Y1_9ROSI
MKFTGKLVDHFDNLDVNTMSMFEVVSMVERLGFVTTVNVFWQLSEVEPETRIESDSNSEDEEYKVEDESSTDQSKFSDSENELASSENEIFDVNVGLDSDEVELRRPGPRTTPTSQATTTQTPSSASIEPTQPSVFRWMPTPTVRTSQESSVSHSSPSPTPISTQPSHPNVFRWMPTPGVPLSQDNCGSHLSPSPSPSPSPKSNTNTS